MSISTILGALVQFYAYLIIAYILMSWFRPATGALRDIYEVLGSITEPYLSIFRRFIPPIGMMDISPIVALIVLQWLIEPLLIGVLNLLLG